jgi:DNA-binding CsgD family transcriptional regulator
LEYEWITGKELLEKAALDHTISMIEHMGDVHENNEFAFWLLKSRKEQVLLRELYEGYLVHSKTDALKAADLWERLGCPYEQALALFAVGESEKRKALTIVRKMGANAVYEKMKLEMRTSGIRGIPRGIRKTTQSNIASLTERELDVLKLLKEGMQNKEIAAKLFISAKTVDHHISAVLFKLDVNSRIKAVHEAIRLRIID